MGGLTVKLGIEFPAEAFKLDKSKATEYCTYYKLLRYGDWWFSDKVDYICEVRSYAYDDYHYILGYFEGNRFVDVFEWGYSKDSIFDGCCDEICQE